AKAGAEVTLLERGELAGQASGAAAGMLVPSVEEASSAPLRELCRASLELYPALVGALQEETGIDVQYRSPGLLVVAQTEGRAKALRALCRQGLAPERRLEWVEGGTLRRLEPAVSDRALGAAYSPEGSHLNPGLLTQALARAAAARGAVLRQGTAVVGFQAEGGSRPSAVLTANGEMIAAESIVLAAGPWTRPLAARLGVEIPTRPRRGQMLAYRSTAVRHIVWGEEGYLVPKSGGFLFAGATVEDVGFRSRTTRQGQAWLRRMAASLVPVLRRAEVVSAWAGLRPGSPDGQPIIGALPGLESVFAAAGHFRNGVLLAPITGRLIARLITEGGQERSLEPFRPGRFR
ncbi:MAG: FAD-dependent oxidoreductase, partial [Dehalococcoidia bacterium]